MTQKRSKLDGKSSGEGITSYRITSYLVLSDSTRHKMHKLPDEAPPEEKPFDPLDEGEVFATDRHGLKQKSDVKQTKDGKIVKKGSSALDKLKAQYSKLKETVLNTVLYPLRLFIFYLDAIIENIALIVQNLGAVLALAYKATSKYIDENNPLTKEEEIELPPDEELDERVKRESIDTIPSKQQKNKISFLDLHELNINFTDNKNAPLFNFDVRKTQTYRPSPLVIDPMATKTAIIAIKECAQRAASIPPAMEGPYANVPLSEVLENITEEDLQNFLKYVKVYPGNYVGRSLKISETFATWIVYGAPIPPS